MMEGILRCGRYAFGPNRLHYCGPDANRELFSYIKEGTSDPGLEALLRGFRTMFPYLKLIAAENKILDPFDDKVVEAYWIGNELLENIGRNKFYGHLVEDQQLKKRLGMKDFDMVSGKLGQGAVPHHSFHVLDIWKRTGNLEIAHTLESMNECRVSWGKVISVDGPRIAALTEPLSYEGRKLFLGKPVEKNLIRLLESEYDIEQLEPGDWISIHWSVPCEIITKKQGAMLKKYTLRHIALANETV